VAGAADLGSPRSAGYPMPAVPTAPVDALVDEAARLLGHRLDPLPQARNSVALDGRPACCGAASCVPVCPTGAKYDAAVHVRKAVAAGAELLDRAHVHRLVAAGGRVTEVGWRTPDGAEHAARPRAVVLAANAVETPRLLRLSGLANSSGL